MGRTAADYSAVPRKWNIIRQAGVIICLGFFILTSCLPQSNTAWEYPLRSTPNNNLTAHSQQIPPDLLATPTRLHPPIVHLASQTPLATSFPEEPRGQYLINARLDYDRHFVQVSQKITTISPAAEVLTELVLVVEANRTKGVFHLNTLRWEDGRAVEGYVLEGAKLHIPLSPPLQPGEKIALNIGYDLSLPKIYGWLAYTDRQLNLGDWYPFLPAYQNGQGWLVHNPGVYGEYLVYPSADYSIALTVLPSEKPLVVAAPSPPSEEQNGLSYQFVLRGARGFAISVSPEYRLIQNGIASAYLFPEHLNAGKVSLETARKSLDLFSATFGAYPYPALTIVEADFFDGMEYTGLFFLGYDYFAAYPGNPRSYLTALSAHETAHQWWYSQVGNDPALEPWLDEAFCTYSELLYYQSNYPEEVDWWWNYRIDRFMPEGAVNSTIYDHPDFRTYVNAVYLQGARFLDLLSGRMGANTFHVFLKDIVNQYRNSSITSEEFFALVRKHTKTNIQDLRDKYFRP